MWLEVRRSVPFPDGRLDHSDSIEAVDTEVAAKEVRILAKWLERNDHTVDSNARGCEQRVEADVRANVEHDVAGTDHSSEQTLFVVLVGAEPASVVARTRYPPIAAQGSLQYGHREHGGNERERKAQQSARDRAIRDSRDVHVSAASALC